MSDSAVDHLVAQALVRSLIERLTPDGDGHFTATASESDVNALRQLAGLPAPSEPPTRIVPPDGSRFGAPAVISRDDLELGCLEAQPEEDGDVLAVDFGTAYSKAALWVEGAEEPTPLPLRDQVFDIPGLILESCAYVTDGVVYFGPHAEAVYGRENARGRKLFDSPKGELSVLRGSSLHQAAPAEIDPTGRLSKRDLLTLYLAYLTGAVSSALEAVGGDRHTFRRYAVPVWEGGKLAEVSGVLRTELVNAQILADSLPLETWRRGLAVSDAERLLRRLRENVTDAQRRSSRSVGEHVLEAAAAAAAVGERLANRRPVALVLDVGAGTTDVGLYRFALPPRGPFKIFPFEHGRGASTLAGNTLDQQLILYFKELAGVDPSTSDGQRIDYALSRDIRAHKATLFQAGFVDIEELDGRRILRDEVLASKRAQNFQAQLKTKITTFLEEVGFERMNSPDGLYGVITGGGANASIFRELFDEPFVLADGRAKFRLLDVQPAWVTDRRPELAPIFPQLAVSVGACSPDVPEERSAITDASISEPKVLLPNYR